MKMIELMLLCSAMNNVIDLLEDNRKEFIFDPRTFSEAKSFQKKLLRKMDFIFKQEHADTPEIFANSAIQFVELADMQQKMMFLLLKVPEIGKQGFTNDFKAIAEKHGVNKAVIKYVFGE